MTFLHATGAPLLDVAGALRRLDDEGAFYASLLGDFVDLTMDLVRQARQAIDRGHAAEAAATLHTIKGMALTVGAQALAEFTAAAEQACLGGRIPAADLAAIGPPLSQTADATLQAVGQWLAAAHSSGPRQPSAAGTHELAAQLTELLTLLQNADMRALELYERLAMSPPLEPDHPGAELDAAMACLDFPRAQSACRTWLRFLPAERAGGAAS